MPVTRRISAICSTSFWVIGSSKNEIPQGFTSSARRVAW